MRLLRPPLPDWESGHLNPVRAFTHSDPVQYVCPHIFSTSTFPEHCDENWECSKNKTAPSLKIIPRPKYRQSPTECEQFQIFEPVYTFPNPVRIMYQLIFKLKHKHVFVTSLTLLCLDEEKPQQNKSVFLKQLEKNSLMTSQHYGNLLNMFLLSGIRGKLIKRAHYFGVFPFCNLERYSFKM